MIEVTLNYYIVIIKYWNFEELVNYRKMIYLNFDWTNMHLAQYLIL